MLNLPPGSDSSSIRLCHMWEAMWKPYPLPPPLFPVPKEKNNNKKNSIIKKFNIIKRERRQEWITPNLKFISFLPSSEQLALSPDYSHPSPILIPTPLTSLVLLYNQPLNSPLPFSCPFASSPLPLQQSTNKLFIIET